MAGEKTPNSQGASNVLTSLTISKELTADLQNSENSAKENSEGVALGVSDKPMQNIIDRQSGSRAEIKGYFDRLAGRIVTGWAFDPANPDTPVELYVLIDGVPRGLILADRARPDLVDAGIGSGFNGFRGELPSAAFDGVEHVIQIVAAETGTVLVKGEFSLTSPIEGVVFLERRQAAIAGWARNVKTVRIVFDDDRAVTGSVDRPVTAFGPGENLGFRVPIPFDLLDGHQHTAVATCIDSGRRLDGNPVTFRLTAPNVFIDIVSVSGGRLAGVVENPRPEVKLSGLVAIVDGSDYTTLDLSKHRASPLPGIDTRSARQFSFRLPPGAKQVAFREVDRSDASVLAAWNIEDETAVRVREPFSLIEDWSAEALASEEVGRSARAAFLRFAQEPGQDFDPSWYLLSYPQVAEEIAAGRYEDALAHYVAAGARAGLSPSGFFSEEEARRTLPFLADEIAKGRLDSAFSLYLHLGKGAAFSPVHGFPVERYVVDNPDSVGRNPLLDVRRNGLPSRKKDGNVAAPEDAGAAPVSLMPRPMHERDPATSIYAAWMSRLALPAQTRAVISAEEAECRRLVGGTILERAPLVSVIMPTFNRAYTIAEAVQSLLDQSYSNWELLICDDASTDKTPLVIAQFSDPRIRYMQFEKSNGAATRNKGLQFAKGEYIAYLDSDNIWDPLFLDVMLRHLMDRPAQPIAYCGYLDTDIVGTEVILRKLSKPPFNPITLSSRNFIDLNTIMHHRKLYDWLGGFDEELPRLQDYDLALRYTSVFPPHVVPYCLAFYRRNVAWGQVTHLFMDKDVQSTVADKTVKRLEASHVRLAVDWSGERPSLTIVASGRGNVASAISFSRLASQFAHVTLVVSAGAVTEFDPSFSLVEVPLALFEHPSDLAYFLSRLPKASAIVGLGFDAPAVRRLCPGTIPGFAAQLGRSGLMLESAADERISFAIGALPMIDAPSTDFPQSLAFGESCLIGTLFPLSESPRDTLAALTKVKKTQNLTLFVAPSDPFSGRWGLLKEGRLDWLMEEPMSVLNAARLQSQFVAVANDVDTMSLGGFSFLMDRLGAGTVALLRNSGCGELLIEAKAAFEIAVSQYDWILDKIMKIELASATRAGLLKNSAKSYQINMHPELTQERIAAFVHHVAFEPLTPEVRHVA